MKSEKDGAGAEGSVGAGVSHDTALVKPIEPVWARIPDVVERFHISENTLRRRMKEGLVRSSKVHGIRAIDVRSVEAMFAAGALK